MTETLRTLFARDINRLKTEIELYKDEKNLWIIDKNIANSAGNLCLHLIGNLNTYIGAILGNSGYVRNRELEFSLKDIPRTELINKIEATIKVVDNALSNLKMEELSKEYPQIVFNKPMTTEYFLVHLVAHLSYHLGQINYHRRLVDL